MSSGNFKFCFTLSECCDINLKLSTELLDTVSEFLQWKYLDILDWQRMDEKFKTWQRKVYIFEEKIRNVEKQRADFRKVILVQLLFHVPLHHIFYLGICDHRADNSCAAFDIYTIKKYVSKGIVVIFMLKIIMITYWRTLFPLPPPPHPPHTYYNFLQFCEDIWIHTRS